ncbi:MAG: hypothetical protein LBH44_08470 [Treponema sp.]|jgi:indole-3-glycerol phosphate synthase|nr:hypothetical protein [Treponema sp.]
MLKFYNREKEVALLESIEQKSRKTAIIAEVKRNSKNINLNVLQKKAVNLARQLSDYTIEYRGFSMSDM